MYWFKIILINKFREKYKKVLLLGWNRIRFLSFCQDTHFFRSFLFANLLILDGLAQNTLRTFCGAKYVIWISSRLLLCINSILKFDVLFQKRPVFFTCASKVGSGFFENMHPDPQPWCPYSAPFLLCSSSLHFPLQYDQGHTVHGSQVFDN